MRTICSLVIGIMLFSVTPGKAQSQLLKKGATAPLFNAKASSAGKTFHFSMQKALDKGPVVLYFFPAAFTRGCDLEAHTFAEKIDAFKAVHTTVIGVSADGIKRLNDFSSDPDYCAGEFPVASDPKGKIAASYGLKMMAPQPGVKDVKGQPVTHGFLPRTTFVINKDGKVVAVFSTKRDRISPDEHVKKALALVKKMK